MTEVDPLTNLQHSAVFMNDSLNVLRSALKNRRVSSATRLDFSSYVLQLNLYEDAVIAYIKHLLAINNAQEAEIQRLKRDIARLSK
jgi:hypothetical protein